MIEHKSHENRAKTANFTHNQAKIQTRNKRKAYVQLYDIKEDIHWKIMSAIITLLYQGGHPSQLLAKRLKTPHRTIQRYLHIMSKLPIEGGMLIERRGRYWHCHPLGLIFWGINIIENGFEFIIDTRDCTPAERAAYREALAAINRVIRLKHPEHYYPDAHDEYNSQP